MFKKAFTIIVAYFWASMLFALDLYDHRPDIKLVSNPYRITSIRLESESYLPHMAHPAHLIETINVDNHTQRILNFSDVFSHQKHALDIISNYARTYYTKKLQQEGDQPAENFKAHLDMIQSGTVATLEHYRHWNITSGYVQIVFERAQVAPSYYGEQTLDIPLSLLAGVLNKKLFPQIFQLQPGDLLFQDLDCGELCNGINSTTYGYQHTTVSHVGMIVFNKTEPMVIEAVSEGVKLTPLNAFLVRSLDQEGHPRVMVGRVDAQTAKLIPAAIKDAMHDLHAPYNATFSPDAKGFYCSQLITRSFFAANHNQAVFASHPMNFKTDHPHAFSPAWVHYFADLKQAIPQGQPGNNPGMMSRDPHIQVVYFYGKLRQK
jgi:uncharacterized protein YycO